MPRDLVHAIEARAEALLEHLPRALDGRARDTHRARVAARRLAEVLPLAGRVGERVARQVRDVRRVLGAEREIDVTIDLLAEEAARHDWPGSIVGRIRRHLDDVAKTRRATWRARRDGVDPGKLGRAIRRVGAEAAVLTVGDVALRLSERRLTREASLARAVKAVGALYEIERLHRVRIEVKKLRYVLEVTAELSARRSIARIEALTAIQEQLGRLHDLQVLQGQIRDVESRFVPGRGRVARDLARMTDDVEADCRALHAAVLPQLRSARHRGVK